MSNLRREIDNKEKESLTDDFWSNQERAQKILKEKKALENKVNNYTELEEQLKDILDYAEIAIMEEEDISKELTKKFHKTQEKVAQLRIDTLLRGDYDKNHAILTIQAGAGGTDAQDWAEMLIRMYDRWAEKKGFTVKVLYLQRDTEGGIKNATLLIEGENAYGYAKNEKGVHRLVRISPFDSSGKRHTSFASVDVMPQIDDDIEIEIDPEDIRIDTFRASGAGGQHVNKTDSAVRITHLPTNIVVSCQNERSQLHNKDVAMRILYAKLLEIKEQEKKETLKELKGDFGQIAWGSQIRSYVFHPYSMVKDHRTGTEVGAVDKVLDGDIDVFINSKLKEELK